MEKKLRSSTIESTTTCPKEAAATLDPLVQPIVDQDGEPVYTRRHSSIFYVPATAINRDENESNSLRRCFNYIQRFSGILYALLASVLATCSNFLLKQLHINILDVLVIRCSAQALISIAFILYKGYRPYPETHAIRVIIRSLFAASGTIAFYYCLSLLPLPDLTTLRYTQVVWTALLAMIIFRERITLPTIIACILTFIGVVCVAQPTFLFSTNRSRNQTLSETRKIQNQQHFIGLFLALSCAITISLSIVLNKTLIQRKVRQSIIMLYFLLTTLLALILIRIYTWIFIHRTSNEQWNFRANYLNRDFIFASIITISQLIPMVLSQKAVKREHPSIITVVQSSDILFALILQNVFTDIKTNLLALLGSTLVLTSIFLVGGHKLWLDRQNRTCLPSITTQGNDNNKN